MPSETPSAGSAEPQIEWDAVARYLAGESAAGERESVERWLARQPADAKVIDAMDDALNALTLGEAATAGIDVEAALARVNTLRAKEAAARPDRAFGIVDGTRGISFPVVSTTRWIPMAAAAAIVLTVGTLVWHGRTAIDEAPTIAARTFATRVGGRDSLQLPDGSGVVLGPGSHLTLAAGYGQRTRNVILDGEAYFDVKHDASRPFVVSANGATIRDIGTAFGVHADSTGDVRVAVTAGVVELSRSAASTPPAAVLRAGDVGVARISGELVARPGAATDDDFAWRRGTLMFRDATIAEVRDDLRRWYGIELVTTDSALLRRHLTATFNDHDSVGSVLANIALSLPATIDRRGDTAMVRTASESRRRK